MRHICDVSDHGLVDAQVFSELVQPDGLHLNPEKYQGNLLRRTHVFLAVF